MSAGVTEAPRPGRMAAWKLAMRLPTLPASVAPVIVGIAVALEADSLRAGPALAALIGALGLQVGANFANDVFDFRKGADTAARVGPPRATQLGLLSQRDVFTGMWLAFGLATLAGIYLVAMAGWPVVAIGAASVIAALIYTGGPWPIGYHALGDLFVFVFFGLVAVTGTVFVQAKEVPALGWFAGSAMGCTVTMILVVNNLRDIPTDRTSGKTTLAVVLGERWTRAWYVCLAVVGFSLAIGSWAAAGPGVLLVVLSLPLLWPSLNALREGVHGAALNRVLKESARWHLVFGLLYSLGIVLS